VQITFVFFGCDLNGERKKMIFFCFFAALLAGAWAVGEVVFQELPTLIKCGELVQFNWTYVGNSSVFSNTGKLFVTLTTVVSVRVDMVSPISLSYPATSGVFRFTGPRTITPVAAELELYGIPVGVVGERTISTLPATYNTSFTCCLDLDCCRSAPLAQCDHINSTFQCVGGVCAPAWCPATTSTAPGLLGCPCSTNIFLPRYQRCAGDYSCDSTLERGLCTVPGGDLKTKFDCTPDEFSRLDSCADRNSSFNCFKAPIGTYCRACTPGDPNCRCDDRRECKGAFCVDGRCKSLFGPLGGQGAPCGRWRSCSIGLVCNEVQLCEIAPANSSETCTNVVDTAAQKCDYATQLDDIDDLLRSAPIDEALPVQSTPAVAPMCAKLRQLLICRARVLGGSGCADSGIGGTVARLCEAIPAARLAALNCGLCEPESCDATKPSCLRGMACIDGKCIIDPQFAICRNASGTVITACPDPAKRGDVEIIELAAKLGTKTAVTDAACTALLEARMTRNLCRARVFAAAGCQIAQPAARGSACSGNGTAERVMAIGCSLCVPLPPLTSNPPLSTIASNPPLGTVKASAFASTDISTGHRLEWAELVVMFAFLFI
jgi:hypothetical protein